MLQLQVKDKYFNAIKAGLKRIEGRLYKKKYQSLCVGDKICFIASSNPQSTLPTDLAIDEAAQEPLIYCIVKVARYLSFREMLKEEGLAKVLPEEHTLEAGVAIYRQFYSESEEMLHGVVAIHFQ